MTAGRYQAVTLPGDEFATIELIHDPGTDRVKLHGAEELRSEPEQVAAQAAAHLAAQASRWWLHVDLDVLDGEEFRACGAAHDPSMPPGLMWAQLTLITRTALRTDGCVGWSIGVYNPDLDPDGREAKRVVAYLADVIEY